MKIKKFGQGDNLIINSDVYRVVRVTGGNCAFILMNLNSSNRWEDGPFTLKELAKRAVKDGFAWATCL